MRAFTFSGINGAFTDINRGEELIELVKDLRAALPAGTPLNHDGIEGQDHFISEINWGTLLSQLGPATLLNGSPVLNAEAQRVAPGAAAALLQSTAGDPTEPVLILAHSQGTNNATFTLRQLLRQSPAFFAQRAVRCLFLDPKVGPNHVQELFVMGANLDFPFLFFQSERDLLSNQGVFGSRFIDQFPFGNHLYVVDLGHGDIIDWDMLAVAKRRWLTRDDYRTYLRDIGKERMRIAQERGKPGWTTADELRVEKFKRNYKMDTGALTPALTEFAQGTLSSKYQS